MWCIAWGLSWLKYEPRVQPRPLASDLYFRVQSSGYTLILVWFIESENNVPNQHTDYTGRVWSFLLFDWILRKELIDFPRMCLGKDSHFHWLEEKNTEDDLAVVGLSITNNISKVKQAYMLIANSDRKNLPDRRAPNFIPGLVFHTNFKIQLLVQWKKLT